MFLLFGFLFKQCQKVNEFSLRIYDKHIPRV
jgi:hypothetical protein